MRMSFATRNTTLAGSHPDFPRCHDPFQSNLEWHLVDRQSHSRSSRNKVTYSRNPLRDLHDQQAMEAPQVLMRDPSACGAPQRSPQRL